MHLRHRYLRHECQQRQHDEEPDPCLQGAAVYTDEDEGDEQQYQGCLNIELPFDEPLRLDDQEHCEDDHECREQVVEGAVGDVHGKLRPVDRGDRRRHRQGEPELPVQMAVLVELVHREDVLEHDRNPVRPVRNRRRQPEEDQQRQRQHRSAGGDDVDEADHDADEEHCD